MLFVPIRIVVFGADYQSVGKHITVFEVIDCFVTLCLCLRNIKPLVCFVVYSGVDGWPVDIFHPGFGIFVFLLLIAEVFSWFFHPQCVLFV